MPIGNIYKDQIKNSLDNLAEERNFALQQFSNLDLARKRAANARWDALSNLDNYLLNFESHCCRRGGNIVWAEDAQTAADEILKIVTEKEINSVALRNGPEIEEIEIDKFLSLENYSCSYSDIASWIIKNVSGIESIHPKLPLLHQEGSELKAKLKQHFNLSGETTQEELLELIRKAIKKDLKGCQLSISNADFILADTGASVIINPDASYHHLQAETDVQIILVGIDRMLGSILALQEMLPLLSAYHYGENLADYINIVLGPKQAHEKEGPKELIYIILDNGRSELLELPAIREVLFDLDGLSHLYNDPLFHQVDQEMFHPLSKGPIGAVVTPFLYSEKKYSRLLKAHPLGNARHDNLYFQNIDELVREARQLHQDQGRNSRTENYIWKYLTKFLSDRKTMQKWSPRAKNYILQKMVGSSWGQGRQLPKFAHKSFHQQWKERQKAPVHAQ